MERKNWTNWTNTLVMVFVMVVVAVVISSIFTGCGLSLKNTDCIDNMKEIKAQMGEPEEITYYDTKNYHTQTWWYRTKGVAYVFTWGERFKSCDMSIYTFESFPK